VVTNEAFARRVGCNYTMASKIRNGTRKPSGGLFTRIVLAYELDAQAATEAYAAGPVIFGDYLTAHVFNAPDEMVGKAG
jgi:hypothetical protein